MEGLDVQMIFPIRQRHTTTGSDSTNYVEILQANPTIFVE